MIIKRYSEYLRITESKKEGFLDWIPFSKDNRPKSDLDIKNNKNIIRESVQKFDTMFGTKYYDKFGMDYQILVGSRVYYTKEVLESLTDEALKPEVYANFDLTSNPENTLYDNIMVDILNGQDSGVLLDYISTKLPRKVYKQAVLYKFFKKFGSEFNNELVKEIFDTKNNYDLGESSSIMQKTIQIEFLNAMHSTMDMYSEKETKGVKKIIDTTEFFTLVIEKLKESEFISTDKIKDTYLKKRLNDWFKWIKSNIDI